MALLLLLMLLLLSLLGFVGNGDENDGLFLFQASSGVEFEEDDVTIFHHIFLALLPVATSSAYTGFRSVLLVIGEFHDFRHDETIFEVRVNFAGSLGRLRVPLDRPRFHLVVTGGEEIHQAQSLIALNDDFFESTLGSGIGFGVSPLLLRRHFKEFIFQNTGKWNRQCSRVIRLDPTDDLGQPFIFLFYVVFFRKIDQVNNGFGRDKQMGVDGFQLLSVPITVTDPPSGASITVFDVFTHFKEGFVFEFSRFVSSSHHRFFHRSDLFIQILDVLKSELLGDDGEISDWINAAFHVGDVFVLESARHVKNGVTRFDVGQEGVAQTLPFRRAFNETGDVDDIQEGGDLGSGFPVVAEPVISLIGNGTPAFVGLNGAERKVLRRCDGSFCQDVEKRRFSDIRKSHDAHLQVGSYSAHDHGLLILLSLLLWWHFISQSYSFLMLMITTIL